MRRPSDGEVQGGAAPPGRYSTVVGKSSENLQENSWQAEYRLQACGPVSS
jgi:hypothetical protein